MSAGPRRSSLKIPTQPRRHKYRTSQISIHLAAAEGVAVSADILELHAQNRAPAFAELVGGVGSKIKTPEHLRIMAGARNSGAAPSGNADRFAPGYIRIDEGRSQASGCFVDVEGIVEDCGLTILPREGGLRKYVEGYVATNPHYIVVPEQLTSYAPRYRPVVAEELCHAILEYDFLNELNQFKLPADAQPHKLTERQPKDIEANAQYLSLAILFPKENSAPSSTNTLRKHHGNLYPAKASFYDTVQTN